MRGNKKEHPEGALFSIFFSTTDIALSADWPARERLRTDTHNNPSIRVLSLEQPLNENAASDYDRANHLNIPSPLQKQFEGRLVKKVQISISTPGGHAVF